MKNVLVTGGGGFLGNVIINQLISKGIKVTSISRSKYPHLEKKGVRLLQADLTDAKAIEKACAGIDTVFHVAAKAGDSQDYKSYYQTNVIGTRNVISACNNQGVRKLVFTSSPSVILSPEPLCDADESLPYPEHYFNSYQKTKAEAEKLVLAANSDTLMTCSIRPHIIWGPGDTTVFPRIFKKYFKNKLRILGTGDNKVSTCYVENCAHAHILAAQSPNVGGKAYFINEKEPVAIWHWLNGFFKDLGLAPITQQVPFGLVWNIAGVIDTIYRLWPSLGEPVISRYLCIQLGLDHYFSTVAAERDFAYQPLVDLELARQKTLKDLKQRLLHT